MENKQNGIVFLPQSHEYYVEETGVQLRGITGIIGKYICPDKYKDVPKATLNNAAARGSFLHDFFEKTAIGFAPEIDEQSKDFGVTERWIADFQKEVSQFDFVENEYLVSDFENFATAIDLTDKENNLFDIKTTAKLDKEYLMWQLSIDAVLFERTKQKKAGKLFAIHTRDGVTKVYEIPRISDEIVLSLLSAAAANEDWENPLKATASDDTANELKEILYKIEAYKAAIADLEEQRDALVAPILEGIKASGASSQTVGDVKISIKAGYTKETFDTKAFKAENEELAAKYIKVSQVGESVSYKIV